jgi:hypothetical protein
MSKKPITWLELIKLKLSEEKSKGKSPSIGDVTPLAKKEWVQIKEGKHPDYIQGKAKTYARKNKGANKKSRKNAKSASASSPASDSSSAEEAEEKEEESMSKSASRSRSKSASPASTTMDIKQLLAELKLCGACKKKATKIMKKKGMSGGSCGGTCINH